jgi:hypothetical protein
MKGISLLIVFLVAVFTSFSQEAKLTIEGTYQGYNVYVQNPFPPCGPLDTCPCVYKVLVNGNETKDDIIAPAFEIDLSLYGFKIGDGVTIDIFHAESCKPKVLSMYHGRKNVLEISPLSIDANDVLHWTTNNEIVKLPFTIQVFRWNKWVAMGEVDGKGSAGGDLGSYENTYDHKLLPHSGENKIRVIQDVNMSNVITWNSGLPEVNCNVDFPAKKIVFNCETSYELYDNSGNLVKKGRGKEIDYRILKHGDYFLNYDNKSQKIKFVKPKSSRAGK